ncbi:MAG: decarboxylase [Flavobacteriaceae bacterium]|nr:decarboxylase [Flavobacteriaceae bacterium]
MRLTFILLSVLIFVSCQPTEKKKIGEVSYKGAMKKIMSGDITAKADLLNFKDTQNFYALGALENLKGEIQVFNSESFNTSVKNNSLSYDKTLSQKAALLVYAEVPEWRKFNIPKGVATEKQFEAYLLKVASENNIDVESPFPFLLNGIIQSYRWHVINWRKGDTIHTHKKHKTSGLYGTINDREVDILGFYSNKHHGIFTHHETNFHMHVKTDGNGVSGHVDEFTVSEGMFLMLPKI